MSQSRLALRLAAIEALCPAATVETGPYLTIAGSRIYDSRIDPIASDADLEALEGQAIVIVYTETDTKRPYDAEAVRYPVGEQIVELVIEIMIAVRGVLNVEQPDGTIATVGTLEAPITDRQHEATLDMLEEVIRFTLENNNGVPSAALFHKIAMEKREAHSVPQRAADRSVRMAARTLKILCKVKTGKWTGNAGELPVPLSLVAAAVPPSSPAGLICAQMAGMFSALPKAPTATGGQIAIFGGIGRTPTGPANADVSGSAAILHP